MRRSLWAGALTVAVMLVSGQTALAQPDSIAICCAWNASLNDSNSNGVPDLAYSIAGGATTDQNTVNAAVQDWAAQTYNGHSLELIPVSASTKTANVTITLKSGGGVIAGSTKWRFDGNGFITSVTIQISLKSFGSPNDQATIGEIAKHEFGHALGLNHADFSTDLMSPVLNGVTAISACDVNGVVVAQAWKFVSNSTTPAAPSASSVTC